MFDNLINIYDDFTKNERTQSLDKLAREYAFEFIKRETFGEQTTFIKAFDIFDKKGTKRFLGIISQKLENLQGVIRFYDYLKTKDLETKTTSIIEIHSPEFNLQAFTIRPRKGLGKARNIFKRKTTSLSEFHRNFKIIPNYSGQVINLADEAMYLLLELKGITVEVDEDYFLFYYKNKEIKLSEILPTMDIAEEFIEVFDIRKEDGFV